MVLVFFQPFLMRWRVVSAFTSPCSSRKVSLYAIRRSLTPRASAYSAFDRLPLWCLITMRRLRAPFSKSFFGRAIPRASQQTVPPRAGIANRE
jgi:hypothetical protein